MYTVVLLEISKAGVPSSQQVTSNVYLSFSSKSKTSFVFNTTLSPLILNGDWMSVTLHNWIWLSTSLTYSKWRFSNNYNNYLWVSVKKWKVIFYTCFHGPLRMQLVLLFKGVFRVRFEYRCKFPLFIAAGLQNLMKNKSSFLFCFEKDTNNYMTSSIVTSLLSHYYPITKPRDLT